MFFRPLLALLCLAASLPVAARATEFKWPGHGVISFDVPAGWKLKGKPADEIGYAFNGRPESGAAAILQITLVNLPEDKPVADADLPGRLQEGLAPFIAQSVEREFRAVPLRCRQGKGWYSQLTDANLVGKPPVPDDYKVMRNALIALDRHALVLVTMQFDDPTAPEADEMLALICSMRFDRVSSSTTAATGPAAELPAIALFAK